MRPSLILTGDWHIREDQPVCRIDNYWETQKDKLLWLSDLQKQYNCPIIHSGDLLNHWKASPFLLSFMLQYLPADINIVYGNHDLPQHSLQQIDKSGMRTLELAGRIKIMKECHWGTMPSKGSLYLSKGERKVLVWHTMTYTGNTPWPGCTDLSAREMLEKYPEFDLIVTGHNHKPFIEELDGRILVNPGSLFRQSAAETHTPGVVLYYAEENRVERVEYTYSKNAISREHIKGKKNTESRYEAFIKQLKQEGDFELSFKKNLERYFAQNKVSKAVQDIIYQKMEEEI